jgi:hypothetical protein
MSGRASLYVVVGFSILFSIVLQNYGSITNRSVDNYIEYTNETAAHNIALSAANIVANQVYRMPMQGPSTSGWKDFQGGKMRWSVSGWVNNRRTLTATGIYGNGASADTSTIQIQVTPNSFSRYAYFSEHERANPSGAYIWWMGKDVVDGPFHTQDDLRVATHPRFLGESTSHFGNLIYQTNKKTDSPIITGLYQPGLSLPIPDNSISELKDPAKTGGKLFNLASTTSVRYSGFSLTFNSNGTVTYTISGYYKSGSSWVPWNSTDSTKTVSGSTLAPNGVIYLGGSFKDQYGNNLNLDMRLKGTVAGQYTVASEGNVYLDDDIVLKTNPKIDPSSTDLLGICAKDYVWITDNTPNKTDINIQAAIFCQDGGFGAQNYDSGTPRGNINLLGGVSQSWRQPVGTFSGTTIKTGYAKQYTYDRRLANNSPPFFPGTGLFRLVSWYEK